MTVISVPLSISAIIDYHSRISPSDRPRDSLIRHFAPVSASNPAEPAAQQNVPPSGLYPGCQLIQTFLSLSRHVRTRLGSGRTEIEAPQINILHWVSPLNSVAGGTADKLTTSCWTCRKRRIKCDERPGACRTCEQSKLTCAGYDVRLIWNAGPNTSRRRIRSGCMSEVSFMENKANTGPQIKLPVRR